MANRVVPTKFGGEKRKYPYFLILKFIILGRPRPKNYGYSRNVYFQPLLGSFQNWTFNIEAYTFSHFWGCFKIGLSILKERLQIQVYSKNQERGLTPSGATGPAGGAYTFKGNLFNNSEILENK